MTELGIFGLYLGANLLLLIIISAHVGLGRRKYKISLGDDGNDDMQRRIRAQGNFVEYTPMAMIGLLAMAMLGGSAVLLHGLGVIYTASRILHFLELGLGKTSKGRLVGIIGTMLSLFSMALIVMFLAFRQ